MRSFTPLALAALAFAAAAGCQKKDTDMADTAAAATPAPPPMASVSVIELGKAIGANRRVSDTTSVFMTRDTVYLSVVTEYAPTGANLMTKWTIVSSGQVVDSTTQPVAPAEVGSSTSVTEFHVTKPGGWEPGMYRVEIWLDGASQGSRDFEIRR